MSNYKMRHCLYEARIAASALQSPGKGQLRAGVISSSVALFFPFCVSDVPFCHSSPNTFSSTSPATHHKIVLCVVPIHSFIRLPLGNIFPHGIWKSAVELCSLLNTFFSPFFFFSLPSSSLRAHWKDIYIPAVWIKCMAQFRINPEFIKSFTEPFVFWKLLLHWKQTKEKKRQRRGSEGLPREQILSLVAVGLNWDINWSLQWFCSTPGSNNQTQDCVWGCVRKICDGQGSSQERGGQQLREDSLDFSCISQNNVDLGLKTLLSSAQLAFNLFTLSPLV